LAEQALRHLRGEEARADDVDVDVYHLVLGFVRIVLGGRAPSGAGVVHPDINCPKLCLHGIDHGVDLVELREIVGDCEHLNAFGLQVRFRFLQLDGLARGNRHLRAHLPQRLGHLQPEAARAAGDEATLPERLNNCLVFRNILYVESLGFIKQRFAPRGCEFPAGYIN
jgi:hypothetical protein